MKINIRIFYSSYPCAKMNLREDHTSLPSQLYYLNSWKILLKWRWMFDKIMLYFDLRPGPKCHSRWCTGRKRHIPRAVMRGNRVGGNWLMKWDELKKFLWYTHRLMHRKRMTCELHDIYFRWMTIKHAISQIEWAIEWTLDYYITQSRQFEWSSSDSCSSSWSGEVVMKATPGWGGPQEPRWSLGTREVADKMQ